MGFGLFCLGYSFADVARRPLMAALVVASLSIAGFYVYQNVALEFYYSWPYAQMGADAFVSADIEEIADVEGGLDRKLEESGVLIVDYRVMVEHEGIAEDVVLHVVPDEAWSSADATIFNHIPMKSALTKGSVWVDDYLASRLGIHVSDEIHVAQRVSDTDMVLKVMAIVPFFAPTNGIVIAGMQCEDMRPYLVSVYAKSEQSALRAAEQLEALGAPVSLQRREDACQSAMILAQEFLPFANSDALFEKPSDFGEIFSE